MADYYDALTSALANLPSAEQPARYAFYDRARRLVQQRLQSAEPPLPDASVRSEMDAFDAAIRQIELELLQPPDPAIDGLSDSDELNIPPDYVRDAAPEDAPAPVVKSGLTRQKIRLLAATAAAVLVVIAGGFLFWGHDDAPPARLAERPNPAPVSQPASPRPKAPEKAASDQDNLPYILRRQLVFYRSNHPAGTLVIAKSQNFLYEVRPNSTAMRYTIGLGPDCSDAMGLYQISRKDGGPGISVASAAPERTASLSETRALYLSESDYRIRQTNTLPAIGRKAPSPGFQLVVEDFSDLFDRTELGTRVVVTN